MAKSVEHFVKVFLSHLNFFENSLFKSAPKVFLGFFVWFFKTGFLCVALAVLEFTLWTRLASNSERSLPPECWDKRGDTQPSFSPHSCQHLFSIWEEGVGVLKRCLIVFSVASLWVCACQYT